MTANLWFVDTNWIEIRKWKEYISEMDISYQRHWRRSQQEKVMNRIARWSGTLNDILENFIFWEFQTQEYSRNCLCDFWKLQIFKIPYMMLLCDGYPVMYRFIKELWCQFRIVQDTMFKSKMRNAFSTRNYWETFDVSLVRRLIKFIKKHALGISFSFDSLQPAYNQFYKI